MTDSLVRTDALRIAIVGTGISGLVCAHLLHPHHDITVFEADDYVGGHTNTVRVDLDDETHHVDTGFIVHNDRNYPNFVKLHRPARRGHPAEHDELLRVATQRTASSTGGRTSTRSSPSGATSLRPSFLRMLADIVRFNRAAKRLLAADADGSADATSTTSLAQFLDAGRYSQAFIDQFLVPLGASIWSADPETFTQFPAVAYARFMDNHGLLDLRGHARVAHRHRRLAALRRRDRRSVRRPHPAADTPSRRSSAPTARRRGGLAVDGPETFDRVILATHSDQSLRLLGRPVPRRARDPRRHPLPAQRRHAAHRRAVPAPHAPRPRQLELPPLDAAATGPRPLTYWMNRLQSIESAHQILVTLNRHDEIDPAQVLGATTTPTRCFDARGHGRPASARPRSRARDGTFFAGAYWEYGFHEDGVRSALDVCRHFGVGL